MPPFIASDTPPSRPCICYFLNTQLSQTTPRPSNPPGELDILLHYRDSFGVDGAQVGIFE